eukprot:365980-Chlamydomonas_euryale.AAC.9
MFHTCGRAWMKPSSRLAPPTVLLQSPLFTLRVEDGDSGSVRKMHMSAMQVCGIAAHATGEPAFVTLTTVGLMPGTMLREVRQKTRTKSVNTCCDLYLRAKGSE